MTVATPIAGLDDVSKAFDIYPENGYVRIDDSTYTIPQYAHTITYYLDRNNLGASSIFIEQAPAGWSGNINLQDGVVYAGEKILISPYVGKSLVYDSDYAENLNWCAMWQSANYALTDDYEANQIDAFLGSTQLIEYGVITGDLVAGACGSYGDDMSGVNFYPTLDEAKSYAKSIGGDVNAVRIKVDRVANVTNARMGNLRMSVVGGESGTRHSLLSQASTDQWQGNVNRGFAPRLTPRPPLSHPHCHPQ